MANDLAEAILNAEDIETVREGVPAYLLLVDSFLRSSPEDKNLLLAAASLNGAYSVFTDETRAKYLTTKSLAYAQRASCAHKTDFCNLNHLAFMEFQSLINTIEQEDVEVAYTLGVAWTGWLQAHSDDWNAIADLSKIKLLMSKVIELDESWDNGGPHLYMGGLETILPASMGGDPEKGKKHFDRALALSEEQFLMTKVVYAEQYARLVFDKPLHDRLLQEVIESNPVVDGMTLTNRIAQERAEELLAESDEYF